MIEQYIICNDKSYYGFIVENYEEDELAKTNEILREVKQIIFSCEFVLK